MGFNKIIIGFVFLFDFRLQGLDILPDFIGYILIFLGLQQIENLHDYFKNAKIFALILIFPSIFTIYENPGQFIEIIITILHLFFIYYLFIGIKQKAEELGYSSLANNANVILILNVIICFGTYLAHIIPLFIIPIIGLGIFTFIFELIILNQAKILEENNIIY